MQDLVQTYLAEKSRRITRTLPDYLSGGHVRAFREATRLSRSEFAVFVGMSAHWVKWFENGNLPLKGTFNSDAGQYRRGGAGAWI
jgi:DNA-binding transcriptional regulator YiaG